MTKQDTNEQVLERFVLDENRYVIDKLNPTGRKGYCHEGSSEDQFHLRECILMARLDSLIGDLFNNPSDVRGPNGNYDPIWRNICNIIVASPLNAVDPTRSIKNRFDGTLKSIKCLREWTSVGLFRDDVERLLRDLYGDIENEAMDNTLNAVISAIEQFPRAISLWNEYRNAKDLEYFWGIGRSDGCHLTCSDYKHAEYAAAWNEIRAHAVLKWPFRFSKYTIEFAKFWDKEISGEPRRRQKDRSFPTNKNSGVICEEVESDPFVERFKCDECGKVHLRIREQDDAFQTNTIN